MREIVQGEPVLVTVWLCWKGRCTPELATEVTAEAVPPLSLRHAAANGFADTGLGIIVTDATGDQLPWLLGLRNASGLTERSQAANCTVVFRWPTDLTDVKRLPPGDIVKLACDPAGSEIV